MTSADDLGDLCAPPLRWATSQDVRLVIRVLVLEAATTCIQEGQVPSTARPLSASDVVVRRWVCVCSYTVARAPALLELSVFSLQATSREFELVCHAPCVPQVTAPPKHVIADGSCNIVLRLWGRESTETRLAVATALAAQLQARTDAGTTINDALSNEWAAIHTCAM